MHLQPGACRILETVAEVAGETGDETAELYSVAIECTRQHRLLRGVKDWFQ